MPYPVPVVSTQAWVGAVSRDCTVKNEGSLEMDSFHYSSSLPVSLGLGLNNVIECITVF